MIVIVESSNGPIPFEVEGGVVRGGASDAVRGLGVPKAEELSERLENALQLVSRVADSMRQAFHEVSIDSAEIMIGVKLTASGDARAGLIHFRTSTGTSGSYACLGLGTTCRW
jgi:Trypsin-co-occurring domain 1